MANAARAPLRAWRDRSARARIETYTQVSMYALFSAAIPLAVLVALETGGAPWLGVTFVVLALAQAVLSGAVFRIGLRVFAGLRGAVPWLVLALAAVTIGMIAVVIGIGPSAAQVGALPWGYIVPVASAATALAVYPAWFSTALAGAAAACILAGLAAWSLGAIPGPVAVPLTAALIVVSVAFILTSRLTAWTMAIVWELDQARAVAGRLAVAQERLRFSRDLHDVFGRTLSTVAVKSELAAALAERGDAAGVHQMLEVRQLAQHGLREVRGLVEGYRRADLSTEIAGARELLRSAGIGCEVSGEEATLPAGIAEQIAWVVREGVTNVVRHSRATLCTITIALTATSCTVAVVNDGVLDGTGGAGTGLVGLAERLAERGGRLTSGAAGDTFTLTARMTTNEESV